jgi:hypothetical protein
MKLAALIEKLAKKAGIDTNADDFKAVTIPDVEVADEIAGKMDKGLLNLDAAKNNADVRKALKAEALNGVDKKVADLLEELGIETADDVKNEPNSYEKITKLAKLIKDTEAAKAKSGTKVDKEGYDKQIADLQKELKTAKEAVSAKETEFKSTRETDLTNYDIQLLLMGKEYSLPKEMGAKLKLQTAKAAIDMELQAKGFKIVRNENGSLAIVDKDGKPAYSDTHEAIDPEKFFDGALAQNKLLKVNDPANPGEGNSPQTVIPGNSAQQPVSANFKDGLGQLESMIAAQTQA